MPFAVVDTLDIARNMDSVTLLWGIHARADNFSSGTCQLVDQTSNIVIVTESLCDNLGSTGQLQPNGTSGSWAGARGGDDQTHGAGPGPGSPFSGPGTVHGRDPGGGRPDLIVGVYKLPGSWAVGAVHHLVLLARVDSGGGTFTPYIEAGVTAMRNS